MAKINIIAKQQIVNAKKIKIVEKIYIIFLYFGSVINFVVEIQATMIEQQEIYCIYALKWPGPIF